MTLVLEQVRVYRDGQDQLWSRVVDLLVAAQAIEGGIDIKALFERYWTLSRQLLDAGSFPLLFIVGTMEKQPTTKTDDEIIMLLKHPGAYVSAEWAYLVLQSMRLGIHHTGRYICSRVDLLPANFILKFDDVHVTERPVYAITAHNRYGQILEGKKLESQFRNG